MTTKWNWNTGISYSKLCEFMVCRERYRMLIEGVPDDEEYSAPLTFGTLYHALKEKGDCQKESREITQEYPANAENVAEQRLFSTVAYEIYKASDYAKNLKILRRELYFFTPYHFADDEEGNPLTINLKGYIDGIVQFQGSTFIHEDKTRGRLPTGLAETLHLNLQSMLYHVGARLYREVPTDKARFCMDIPIGTIYDTLVRPGGSRSSPRPRKAETRKQYLTRLCHWYEDNFKDQFSRSIVNISEEQVAQFQIKVLDPLLLQLWYWYQFYKDLDDPWENPHHYLNPWGVWNSMSTGYGGRYERHFKRAIHKTIRPSQMATNSKE